MNVKSSQKKDTENFHSLELRNFSAIYTEENAASPFRRVCRQHLFCVPKETGLCSEIFCDHFIKLHAA